MAFTKIQPQQLQLPNFLSPSGDLTFVDNSTGFNIDLNRNLEGDFNIDGNLTLSSSEVLVSNSTNSSDSDGKTIGGQNNIAIGLNAVVNGDSIEASGSFNTALNGSSSNFGKSGQFNTIVGGRNIAFSDQITGSMVIADQKSSAQSMSQNHSLLISFDSGVEFKCPNSGVVFSDNAIFNDIAYFNDSVDFEDQVNFNSNIVVDSTAVFNEITTVNSSLDVTGESTVGNLNVTGNLGVTGNLAVTGTAEFDGRVNIDDILTLNDGSQAASHTWVNETGVRLKISHESHAALPTYLDTAYSNSFGTNSSNILSVGQPVTGLLFVDTVPDPDEAKLVFVTESFTGVIDFTKFQYTS
jgi:hypothetical protein